MGGIHDLITHAQFGDDHLRGSWVVWGSNLTLLVVLTTLTLPCERDTIEVMANFLVKFPIFRYHGNRGRLSKV